MVFYPEQHEDHPYLKGHKRGYKKVTVTKTPERSLTIFDLLYECGFKNIEEMGFFNFGPLENESYLHRCVLGIPTANYVPQDKKTGKVLDEGKWTVSNVFAEEGSWMWAYGDSNPEGDPPNIVFEVDYVEEGEPDEKPEISSLDPASTDSLEGGETITIKGKGFLKNAKVKIGKQEATKVEVKSSTELTFELPEPGERVKTVDVEIINPDEWNVKLDKGFSYDSMEEKQELTSVSPDSTDSLSGGGTITITGDGFVPKSQVKIGGIEAKKVVFKSKTEITAQIPTPDGKYKTVNVEVIDPFKTTAKLSKCFTYSSIRQIKRVGLEYKDDSKYEYTEEALILVWPDKNMTSLKTSKQRPGHASLKLKKRNATTNKVEQVEYISWFPSMGSDKFTPNQPGSAVEEYAQDQASEIRSERGTIIFLSYMWFTLHDPDHDPSMQKVADDSFKSIAKEYWDLWEDRKKATKSDKVKKRYQKMLDNWEKEFGKEFSDFGKKAEGYMPRGDTKLNKDLKAFIDKEKKKLTTDVYYQKFTKELTNKVEMLNFHVMMKRASEKIYLPCACLPEKTTKSRSVVWGLSLDLMRYHWLIFTMDNNQKYVMMSHKSNCSAAVWHTLIAGYGDLFTDFKAKNFLIGLFSYVPSDFIPVGEKLDEELGVLNDQQNELDQWAQSAKKEVLPTMDGIENTTNPTNTTYEWKKVFEPTTWKKISKLPKKKRRDVKNVDKQIDEYKKTKDELAKSKTQKLYDDVAENLKNYWAADQTLDTSFNAAIRKIARKVKKESYEFLEKNYETFKNNRRKQVERLILLHHEVHKYAKKNKGDVTKNKRLPAVLLLGRCVALEFCELGHIGIKIPPLASDDSGDNIFINKYEVVT